MAVGVYSRWNRGHQARVAAALRLAMMTAPAQHSVTDWVVYNARVSRAEKGNTGAEPALADAAALMRDVARAMERHPHLDADTVRHTLALLRLDPLTRLNRSLIRGRALAADRA